MLVDQHFAFFPKLYLYKINRVLHKFVVTQIKKYDEKIIKFFKFFFKKFKNIKIQSKKFKKKSMSVLGISNALSKIKILLKFAVVKKLFFFTKKIRKFFAVGLSWRKPFSLRFLGLIKKKSNYLSVSFKKYEKRKNKDFNNVNGITFFKKVFFSQILLRKKLKRRKKKYMQKFLKKKNPSILNWFLRQKYRYRIQTFIQNFKKIKNSFRENFLKLPYTKTMYMGLKIALNNIFMLFKRSFFRKTTLFTDEDAKMFDISIHLIPRKMLGERAKLLEVPVVKKIVHETGLRKFIYNVKKKFKYRKRIYPAFKKSFYFLKTLRAEIKKKIFLHHFYKKFIIKEKKKKRRKTVLKKILFLKIKNITRNLIKKISKFKKKMLKKFFIKIKIRIFLRKKIKKVMLRFAKIKQKKVTNALAFFLTNEESVFIKNRFNSRRVFPRYPRYRRKVSKFFINRYKDRKRRASLRNKKRLRRMLALQKFMLKKKTYKRLRAHFYSGAFARLKPRQNVFHTKICRLYIFKRELLKVKIRYYARFFLFYKKVFSNIQNILNIRFKKKRGRIRDTQVFSVALRYRKNNTFMQILNRKNLVVTSGTLGFYMKYYHLFKKPYKVRVTNFERDMVGLLPTNTHFVLKKRSSTARIYVLKRFLEMSSPKIFLNVQHLQLTFTNIPKKFARKAVRTIFRFLNPKVFMLQLQVYLKNLKQSNPGFHVTPPSELHQTRYQILTKFQFFRQIFTTTHNGTRRAHARRV